MIPARPLYQGVRRPHLSRPRLFQRHLWSLGCAWVWGWDWILSSHALSFFSPPSFHTLGHKAFPPRSLVCGCQPSPHKPRLVVSHSSCPPLSSSPHAHSFVIGPAVINTHTGDRFGIPKPQKSGVEIGADRRRSGPCFMLPKGVPQGQTESGGIVLAAICWAPSAQRRCYPKEALYFPTFTVIY
jgi:hypothetical protein